MARPPSLLVQLLHAAGNWFAQFWLLIAAFLGSVLILTSYLAGGFAWPEAGNRSDLELLARYLEGVLAPFLAFMVLLGIVVAIREQRRELVTARRAMEQSARALIEQKNALELQNFEYTFFEMLKLLDATVANLRLVDGEQTVGRDAMLEMWNRLERNFEDGKSDDPARDHTGLAYLSSVCVDFFSQWSHLISHYFTMVTNLLRLVDRAPLRDREFYALIVRGMLSRAELSLLFYVCLTRLADEQLNLLAKRYQLFGELALVEVLEEQHRDLFR